jgi:hypothetical protein
MDKCNSKKRGGAEHGTACCLTEFGFASGFQPAAALVYDSTRVERCTVILCRFQGR